MVHSVGHWNHIYTEYCLRLHIQWCNIPLHTHHLALFPGCAPYNMSNTPMCCLGNDILCKNSPRPFIFFTASNWYIYIIAWMGGWYDKVNGEDSPLIQTLRLENFADVSTVFIRAKAFSQNVGKVFRSQGWYQRILFSVYAGANWEATTSIWQVVAWVCQHLSLDKGKKT